eukprot:1041658-Pleurochrysis_carterae.AAC.1
MQVVFVGRVDATEDNPLSTYPGDNTEFEGSGVGTRKSERRKLTTGGIRKYRYVWGKGSSGT